MTNPHIPDGYDTAEAFLDEARRRFQEGVDADRDNREAALDDLKFVAGDQWDETVRAGRLKKGRPCTTSNNAYTDTPNNAVELVPAQTKGARITKITALARATNTATELQLFVSSDSGTTKRFIDSQLMAAYTVAQTTKQNKVDFQYSETFPLILSGGESLYAAIGVSNTGIVFRAEGGGYL